MTQKECMTELHRPKIAILASGEGGTAEAYARAVCEERIDHEIGLVIVSKEDAGILKRVERWNEKWGFDTKSVVINKQLYPGGPCERGQTEDEAEAICAELARNETDIAIQLGYLVIGNDPYTQEWGFLPRIHTSPYQARALNSHPGLLPLTADTYGPNASRLMIGAYRRGEINKATHTIHCVAQEVDAGPIVAEQPVEILPSDTEETLFKRIRKVEQTETPYAVDAFIRERRRYLTASS